MNSQAPRTKLRTKSIEKRQRILDATAKLIAEKGSSDITLHDVGREVGMYAASIYYYFSSREELIKEVHIASLSRMQSQVADAVAALPPGSAPLDRLRHAIRVTIGANGTADDYALAYTRVLDKAVAPADEEIRRSRQQIRALWLGLLKDAQDAGEISPAVDLSLLCFFLIGSVHWVSYWYRPDGPKSASDVADAFFDFLIHGAAGAAGGQPSA